MTDNPEKAEDLSKEIFREEEEGEDHHDYAPYNINKFLYHPDLLPPEYRREYGMIFEEFEFSHLGRAKTALEFMLVNEATKLVMNIERYERMKGAIFLNEQRPAVESLFRKTHDSSGFQLTLPAASAKSDGQKYFANPEFKAKADAKFEAAGYAPDALEGEAYLRALPSLALIEKQIAAAQKRLVAILKDLEASYSSRDPEKKLTIVKKKSRTAKKN